MGSYQPPFPQASVAPRGGTTLACGGLGGPNSYEEIDTLVLYVYYNPSTAESIKEKY